jgi:N-acyl homoserine lactone hydrolase
MKVFHATTHPTQPAQLGTPSGSAAMEALIDQPGSVQVKTIGVDWQANLSGVLNLKDPKAKAAGLTNRKEPIKIYAHVLRHPSKGFFLVDTGVSERFAHDAKDVGVGLMLRKYAGIQDMHTDPSTAQIIDAEGAPLAGVIMTHLHLDHVSGLPDIPQDTPIYVGAHEAEASLFLNLVARPTNNNLLTGRPPLQELQFEKDPDGMFEVWSISSATARSSRSTRPGTPPGTSRSSCAPPTARCCSPATSATPDGAGTTASNPAPSSPNANPASTA